MTRPPRNPRRAYDHGGHFEDENELMGAEETVEETNGAIEDGTEAEPAPAMAAARDLFQAKRGAAVLATCIVQTINETDRSFQDRLLRRLSDAYYEIRDNYDGRWTGNSVNHELELLAWTRELLTGWDFFTGRTKPFLGR